MTLEASRWKLSSVASILVWSITSWTGRTIWRRGTVRDKDKGWGHSTPAVQCGQYDSGQCFVFAVACWGEGDRTADRNREDKLIKKALWSGLSLKQSSTVVAERRMLLKLTWVMIPTHPRHAQEVITSSTFSQSAPGSPLNRPLYSSCLMHNHMIFNHISIFQMCWRLYLLLLSVFLKSHKKIISFSHHFSFLKSIYIRFWST